MKQVFQELVDHLSQETSDIDSEILRTLQLFVRAKPKMPEIKSVQKVRQDKKKKLSLSITGGIRGNSYERNHGD